jgi:uncharacterized protein (UPF0303 family)
MSAGNNLPSPEEVLAQERALELPSLSENDAIAVGMSILAKAELRNLPITIEVRRGARIVFRAARVGTCADNDVYVAGKARLVERFGHSTMYARVLYERAGRTFAEANSLGFPEYVPHGGGFPLVVQGTGPVGVVVVSGLPDYEDHALIVECLSELRERQAS